MAGEVPTLILLSGGIDSATALAVASAEKSPVSTLFIDYGQSAAASEGRASAAIARRYGATHRRLAFQGLSFASGEIRGRNAFFLHAALLAFESDAGVITIAVHLGTPYRDCSPQFVRMMQASYDFHTGGAIGVAAPFIDLSKGEVFELATKLKVPIELTHSCEAGNSSCHRCLSCLDREALIASA
jgi:7-cyano-7-deazaguanine synthase